MILLNFSYKLVVCLKVINLYLQDNIFKMENTNYTLDDMTEYDDFLTRISVDKSQFIDHLNIVTSPNSQLCDFNTMLSYVRDVDGYVFKYIVNSFNEDPIYFRVWYLYFKFLLLDDDIKDSFHQKYNKKIQSVSWIFEVSKSKSKQYWDNILQVFYELVNDDYLQNFMDNKDNYRQYQRLDLSKKHNIKYKKDKYMDNFELDKFYEIIVNYDNVHFFYNLIYCISDKYGYEKIENSNGLIDFQQRFHSNIDKFIILYNVMTIFYNEINDKNMLEEEEELIIENIPTNNICNSLTDYRMGKKRVLVEETKYDIIRCLFDSYLMVLPKRFDREVADKFLFYLQRVLKYDLNEDRYKLYYYKYSISNYHIEFQERYMDYLESKLVKGLNYLNSRVYSQLMNINIDENCVELKTFLEKIFEELNYRNLIHFL